LTDRYAELPSDLERACDLIVEQLFGPDDAP
jgi:hypothetical protein